MIDPIEKTLVPNTEGVITMKNRLSRRDFLKLAGISASAGVLASCAPAATPTPEVPAAVTEAVKEATGGAKIEGELNVWSWADNPFLRDTAAAFSQTQG